MEDWDLETVEKVVESKGKEYNQDKSTDIVCKHFLDAVEKKQYGWFWVCPIGNKECHYRHALPPGYILKSQMKALLEEEANKLAIEDEIEDQFNEEDGKVCQGRHEGGSKQIRNLWNKA
ncbi:putative transcription factor C3H family [Helianthus annuus]|nr:putative transcription factor C3H family [Helianthus annuus]KAJ0520201.1 putative transcription factor C3H family [Helianthus annuus]KAJ0695664.1 putative transcription factor C3H family [Helianthus annuus]